MVSRRAAAPPHPHHLDLVQEIAGDVRRELDRMGRMRALTVVRLAASGAYRVTAVPAADVRLGLLAELGIAAVEAIAVIDDVLDYDPSGEAAILVVERNPIDGTQMTFAIHALASAR